MVYCLPLADDWLMLLQYYNIEYLIKDKEHKQNYVIPFFYDLLQLSINYDYLDSDPERLEEVINKHAIISFIPEDYIPAFHMSIANIVNALTTEVIIANIYLVKEILDVTVNDITIKCKYKQGEDDEV